MNKYARGVFIAIIYLCTIASNCHAADGKIALKQQPGKLLINIDSQTIATYVYEDSKILRPYFTGLKSLDGVQVTRNHPPHKGIDSDDHETMHPGLWLAFGDINGNDFWRNKATVKHAGFSKITCKRFFRC